jgi:hypothetical protein
VRLALAIVLVCLTAAACGGGGAGRASSGPATTRIAPPRLATALLTTAQVRDAAGVYVRVPGTSLTDNPDPRAPCGARVSLPPLREGAVAIFRSKAPAEIDQWILDLPPGAAAKLVRVAERDVRPGCPAYRSATPYGPAQQNRFVRTIALPSLGDGRLAAIVRLSSPAASRPFYGTEIMIREGDRLSLISLVGFRPPPARIVRAVATRAAADMRILGPSASVA